MNRFHRLFGVLLALPLCAIAQAGAPAKSLSQLLACRQITGDAARLTCFDRTSAALAQTPMPAPAQSPQAPTQAMKEALDPQRTFGLPHATVVQRAAAAEGIRVKAAANITARIVHMSQDQDGRTVFSLDNGQVWEQLVPDGADIYAKPGDSVQISRGWLESYWLEAPSHHGYKVTRLR